MSAAMRAVAVVVAKAGGRCGGGGLAPFLSQSASVFRVARAKKRATDSGRDLVKSGYPEERLCRAGE